MRRAVLLNKVLFSVVLFGAIALALGLVCTEALAQAARKPFSVGGPEGAGDASALTQWILSWQASFKLQLTEAMKEAKANGAALWGLSLALHEGTAFENGQVKDTNLDSYTPLRMGDVPDLDIEFMPSSETPVGLGEPGTTVVAPAIGNAIFRAVGARVRDLPIRPEAVKAAMKMA